MCPNNAPKEDIISRLLRVNLVHSTNDNYFPSFHSKLSKAKKLRAFICTAPSIPIYDMETFFNKFSCLRMLDLSSSVIEELPSSIGKLIHLRYLNLSNSPLAALPYSITGLYNLQSLILKNCFRLGALPREMMKLIKLRHLIICNSGTDKWSLRNLPMPRLEAVRGIGNEFYANSTHRSVCSFPCLEDLSILRLENLVEWHEYISSSSSSADAAASNLPCLKYLRVKFCRKLTVIPTRLPSLQELELEHVNGECISSVVESNLTSLTSVRIRDCKELVFLPQGLLRRNMVLLYLGLSYCERFQGFSIDQVVEEEEELQQLPNSSICILSFYNCNALISLPHSQGFNSLSDLRIIGSASFKSIPVGIERLCKLEALAIGMFSEELDYFPLPAPDIDGQGNVVRPYFPALRSLIVLGWSKLKSLPDHIQYLTSLKTLWIQHFPSVVALPDWLGKMTSLQELKVKDCRKLKHLPSQEQMLHLTSSLRKIDFKNCKLLKDRCRVRGEEYHKISHTTKI
ncbi:hypothetical protein MKX03_021761, partial [Papaver bracteatum]